VAAAIVKVTDWLFVPAALVAVKVALKLPGVEGVPVITPFVATESPGGRLVPENVTGALPVAERLLLNATPTVPAKALVLVIVGGVEMEATVTVPAAASNVACWSVPNPEVDATTPEYPLPLKGPP
jgi:hypothetical protein